MRGRFCPAPLGIVLWYDKLEFAEESTAPEQRVIPNQSSDWCGNLHRLSVCFSSCLVGALIERPAEKFLIFRFLSAKWFLFFGLFCEIGRFSRALKMSAPTRYDEMQSESRWRFPHQSEDWFGMTRSYGPTNSNIFLCETQHAFI